MAFMHTGFTIANFTSTNRREITVPMLNFRAYWSNPFNLRDPEAQTLVRLTIRESDLRNLFISIFRSFGTENWCDFRMTEPLIATRMSPRFCTWDKAELMTAILKASQRRQLELEQDIDLEFDVWMDHPVHRALTKLIWSTLNELEDKIKELLFPADDEDAEEDDEDNNDVDEEDDFYDDNDVDDDTGDCECCFDEELHSSSVNQIAVVTTPPPSTSLTCPDAPRKRRRCEVDDELVSFDDDFDSPYRPRSNDEVSLNEAQIIMCPSSDLVNSTDELLAEIDDLLDKYEDDLEEFYEEQPDSP